MNRRYILSFLLLQTLYPACVLLGHWVGREFVLASEALYLVAVTAVSGWLAMAVRKAEPSWWGIPALVLALVHSLMLLLTLRWWGAGFAAVAIIVCGWLIFDRTPRGITKGIFQVLTLLLTWLLLLVIPIWLYAAAMGSSRTVMELDSPGGSHTAIVTSSDQGALGGDTYVNVRNNRTSLPIVLGTFEDRIRFWQGGFGDWEGMELFWPGETDLSINGIVYSVSGADAARIAEISRTLGATITGGKVLGFEDSHGGFHGDGSTFVKLQGSCTIPDSRFWHLLPADENVATAVGLCPQIPKVEKGWYYFQDRHPNVLDPASDAAIHRRSSWNFTLAVYDETAQILYYFELDT